MCNDEQIRMQCPASCGVCQPTSYSPKSDGNLLIFSFNFSFFKFLILLIFDSVDCTDRHQSCGEWAANGQCVEERMPWVMVFRKSNGQLAKRRYLVKIVFVY